MPNGSSLFARSRVAIIFVMLALSMKAVKRVIKPKGLREGPVRFQVFVRRVGTEVAIRGEVLFKNTYCKLEVHGIRSVYLV